jgi:hypothetical protein
MLLILVMLIAACGMCFSFFFRENDTNSNRVCRPLPEGFSETDLVGTWIARSIDIIDTLIIQADGTYKQSIHIEYKSLDYESDWQPWRFEYRENGTGYLHMDQLRTCASNPDTSCDWVNDGNTPWADVCEGQWIKPYPPAGEIILVAYGHPFLDPNEKLSYPFSLTLFQGFESGGWSYNYQEP